MLRVLKSKTAKRNTTPANALRAFAPSDGGEFLSDFEN
jgi:hypothetical protein